MNDELLLDAENSGLSLEDADRILRNVFIACGKEPVSLCQTIERMQAEHTSIEKESFAGSKETPKL